MFKKNEKNTEEVTDDYYGNMYDDTPTPSTEIKKNNKKINTPNDSYEETKEKIIENFESNNKKNNSNALKTILFLILFFGLITIIYISISSQGTNYQVKFNLTSMGIVKSKGRDNSYQINYLMVGKSNSKVTFKESNKDIVKFNDVTVNVTPIKAGQSEIKAYNEDGKEIGKMDIYVVNKEIQIEDFAVSDIELNKGKKDMIVITIAPSDATTLNFSYTSSDNNIVSVSNNGVIKALNKGEATITIKNGKIIKTINVKVK